MTGTHEDNGVRPTAMLRIKRAYEPPEKSDGIRVLVDRMWPRGVKKESLELSFWLKDLAPSTALRQWFGHDPAKWEEFRKRYRAELKNPKVRASLKELAASARKGCVTLIYSARDERHNQAEVLKEVLDSM